MAVYCFGTFIGIFFSSMQCNSMYLYYHNLFIIFHTSDANSNQNAMSASHLLLSYSTNVLRPLSEIATDKNPILEKIKRYEGTYTY